jgi:hypothetical protein
VSGHFRFQVVSGRVRSGIELSSRIILGFGSYPIGSSRVGSGIESSSIRSFWVSGHIRSGRIGIESSSV